MSFGAVRFQIFFRFLCGSRFLMIKERNHCVRRSLAMWPKPKKSRVSRHNRHELLSANFPISILVKLVNHGSQLIVRQILSQLSGYSSKIAETDFSRVVVIEQPECLNDFFLWVSSQHLFRHDIAEV